MSGIPQSALIKFFFEIHLTQFRRIVMLQKLHSWKHFRNSFLNRFLKDLQEHAPGQALGIQSLINSLYAGFKTIAKVNFSEFFEKWRTATHTAAVGKTLLSSIKGRLLSKVVFCRRSSFIKGRLLSSRLPPKVIFHRGSSSMEGCLPLNTSSIKGRLPSKVVFYRRSSFIKGRLSSKVVFHQRSSSIKLSFIEGCLPLKGVFHRTSLP